MTKNEAALLAALENVVAFIRRSDAAEVGDRGMTVDEANSVLDAELVIKNVRRDRAHCGRDCP